MWMLGVKRQTGLFLVWVIVVSLGIGTDYVAGYGLYCPSDEEEDIIIDGNLRPIVSINLEKSGYTLEKIPDEESEYILKVSGV